MMNGLSFRPPSRMIVKLESGSISGEPVAGVDPSLPVRTQ